MGGIGGGGGGGGEEEEGEVVGLHRFVGYLTTAMTVLKLSREAQHPSIPDPSSYPISHLPRQLSGHYSSRG